MAGRNIDVSVRARVGQFISPINSAKNAFGGFISAVQAGIGALAIRQVASEFSRVVNEVDELATTAMKLDIPARNLDAMRYASTQLDVEFQTLEKSAIKLRKNIFEAGQGVREQAEAFQLLNVDIKQLALAPLNVQLATTFDALSRVGNITDQTALAMRLFGKGGSELLPIIRSNAGAFAEFYKEALNLNGALGDTSAAEKADEGLKRLAYTWEKFEQRIIASPAFKYIVRVIDALGTLGSSHDPAAGFSHEVRSLVDMEADLERFQGRREWLQQFLSQDMLDPTVEGTKDAIIQIQFLDEAIAGLIQQIEHLKSGQGRFFDSGPRVTRDAMLGIPDAHPMAKALSNEGIAGAFRRATNEARELWRQFNNGADLATHKAQKAVDSYLEAQRKAQHAARIDEIEELRERLRMSPGTIESAAASVRGSVEEFSARGESFRERLQERVVKEAEEHNKKLDDMVKEARRNADASEGLLREMKDLAEAN